MQAKGTVMHPVYSGIAIGEHKGMQRCKDTAIDTCTGASCGQEKVKASEDESKAADGR